MTLFLFPMLSRSTPHHPLNSHQYFQCTLYNLYLVIFPPCYLLQLVQELWATDLKLNYGDGSAITLLLSFVTRGAIDYGDHSFNVATPLVKVDDSKRIRRRRACEEDKVSLMTKPFNIALNSPNKTSTT